MTKIKINGKDYNIYFGYAATVKNGIIKKLVSLENNKSEAESIDKLLLFLPELLLIGLQKFHSDEFGFNPERTEEKEAQMDKVYELLDSYFDEEDSDLEKLYTALQSELIENGFLSKMFREEQAKAKTVKAVEKAES